jgi:hypothetical protein
MKLIDRQVASLRERGRPVLASFVKTWRSGVSFMFLAAVAVLDKSHIPLAKWGRVAIAAIALATWATNAYFKRKWWRIGKEEPN